MDLSFHATTICAVRHNGKAAIAGDGQVTFGENVIMKQTAKKVRRLYRGQVVAGFAGSVADAITLLKNSKANWRSIMAICSVPPWSSPRTGARIAFSASLRHS